MGDDLMLKCLICFILGWFLSRQMGNGFSVGGVPSRPIVTNDDANSLVKQYKCSSNAKHLIKNGDMTDMQTLCKLYDRCKDDTFKAGLMDTITNFNSTCSINKRKLNNKVDECKTIHENNLTNTIACNKETNTNALHYKHCLNVKKDYEEKVKKDYEEKVKKENEGNGEGFTIGGKCCKDALFGHIENIGGCNCGMPPNNPFYCHSGKEQECCEANPNCY